MRKMPAKVKFGRRSGGFLPLWPYPSVSLFRGSAVALIHREFILGPVFKAFWRIGRFLAVELVDGTFVSEICELNPISLGQRQPVLDQDL
jgi:hypothetical protein